MASVSPLQEYSPSPLLPPQVWSWIVYGGYDGSKNNLQDRIKNLEAIGTLDHAPAEGWTFTPSDEQIKHPVTFDKSRREINGNVVKRFTYFNSAGKEWQVLVKKYQTDGLAKDLAGPEEPAYSFEKFIREIGILRAAEQGDALQGNALQLRM